MKTTAMKGKRGPGFIAPLTTTAGMCLTMANWQEAGITALAYSLESLLIKPGMPLLEQVPNLAGYIGWSGDLVLNGIMPKSSALKQYNLVSPYDGSRLSVSFEAIMELIAHLSPDYILMPQDTVDMLSEALATRPNTGYPFFWVNALPDRLNKEDYGVYFIADGLSDSQLVDQVGAFDGRVCYVTGTVSLGLMQALLQKGVGFVESNQPALDAFHGKVYRREGSYDLTDALAASKHSIIDTDCHCPTCTQQFTKAYLHHLLANTPLLAQRLILQHNLYFMKKLSEIETSSFTPPSNPYMM